MAVWHSRSMRKKSGGLYHRLRKHKKYELGREPTNTTIGDTKIKFVRMRGGKKKIRVMSADYVVVSKDGKTYKVKLLDVIENKANMHFIKKKIITKGAIIQTEMGKARVTSRPGQDGIINAVLIE